MVSKFSSLLVLLTMLVLSGCGRELHYEEVEELSALCESKGGEPVVVLGFKYRPYSVRCRLGNAVYSQGNY
ncbi:lipoprotein-attachment domain-containing protein [Pseudomonas phage EM]|uniref:Lipoprotein-attachment domain-containing protein n=1 Tax=Pseudomonas phage EM TaxID=2936914 RepID=A0AAE9KSK5_9CAUD|nr:lipoprotein-attachment domain-containing protein [Pseudomonas phage EM]UPW35913.1 lipoprotein-attachment domain-containing protein [Pseudomonas phage EM]